MFSVNSPFKLQISTIEECKINPEGKTSITFTSQTSHLSIMISFESVWLQGFIEGQPDIDGFILNDGTGKVSVKHLALVDGDKRWIKEGVYCLVLGTLSHHFPSVVTPFKIANLQNNANLIDSWPFEVRELKSSLCNIH